MSRIGDLYWPSEARDTETKHEQYNTNGPGDVIESTLEGKMVRQRNTWVSVRGTICFRRN